MTPYNGLIRKAVFPVAGLGTRFLPATKASPKEMLSVVNKPLIQYAVEEAYAAGIREMIFITCNNKSSIENHFDTAYQLESELESHQKEELLSLVRSVKPDDMACVYIRQPKMLGMGHAVLCAEPLIDNEPFAVLLADDLLISERFVMQQLIDQFDEHNKTIIAVEPISEDLTQHYGIIQGNFLNERLMLLHKLVEKPSPQEAPSNLAIVGRYILTPTIFKHIKSIQKRASSEIQLTDAITSLLTEELVYAYLYEGIRYDCGSVTGFLKANVALGQKHPYAGEDFRNWLQEITMKDQNKNNK